MERDALLMPFLDSSETFTLGFECGQIWEKIQEGETLNKYPVHTKNKEQIELICKSFGVEAEIDYVNEDWSQLTTKSSCADIIG